MDGNVVLSVVSPCFNERENIATLYAELRRVLEGAGVSFEVIMVENGSTDGSFDLMLALANDDPRLKVVQLSRNFGYQGAISAGMAHAAGEFLVCIDADLQDPPELIPVMLERALSEGCDIVYGVRRSRQEGPLRSLSYKAFYRLMQRITPFDMPLDAGDFALINRTVLDTLLALPEKDRFLRGLRAWVGFHSVGIPYDRRARTAGESKFSPVGLFVFALQGLFSFSFLPVRMLFNLGVAICLMIVPLIIGYTVWRVLVPSAWPPGVATILILLLTQIGLTMAGIGLIGEYLSIIFVEVKRRPTFVTRRRVNLPCAASRASLREGSPHVEGPVR